MAFHPFQFFRKRQKTFLAILTIFVMFIFILSWGGRGDALTTIMSWMGGGGRGKDKTEVTKLYGKTITVGEVEQVRASRRAVDTFMQRAVGQAEPKAGNVDPPVKARLDQLAQNIYQSISFIRQVPAQFIPQFLLSISQNYETLRREQQTLRAQGKTDAAEYAAALARPVGLMLWRQSHPGQLYFGGTLSTDDLLDFLLWRQQADMLNITLTDEDVRREVNREAGSEVLSGKELADAEKLRPLLQGAARSFTVKEFYDALRDEFRVRLAQEALLGNSPGARQALGTGLAGDDLPAGGTPEEFWEFYKDKRTALDVGFVRVPVSQFTGQVKEEPTEKELVELFERYKNDEPNPERERPGFKVPRRIKVEWVSANPDADYYRKESARALQLLAATRPLMAAGTAGGIPALDMALGAALAPDLDMQAEYEAYVTGTKSWWDANPLLASSLLSKGVNPYAKGLNRAETFAAAVGQLFAAGATGAPLWGVDAALQGATDLQLAEQRARAVSIALAGSSPFVPAVIAQEAAYVTVPVQPLSAVRDVMAERAREHLGPHLASGALDTFQKDVDAKRSSPKEAAEFIQKNANSEHGITAHGAMTEARDATDIINDPALAPLRGAKLPQVALTPQDAKSFADALFRPSQTYHPEPYHGTGDTLYYFWLTENDRAYVPSFEEARPKVEAAWKFNKARALALEEADKIVAAMKERSQQGASAERYLRDEAARRGWEWYSPATSVAKLDKVPDPGGPASNPTQYRPYAFDEARLPYMRSDTVDKLFQDLTTADSATVIKDRPIRNYYVAVLKAKPNVPTEEEFFRVYMGAPRRSFSPDSMWWRFQIERDEKYRTELVKQFREEATPKVKPGDKQQYLDDQKNYVMDPEVRKRLASGRGEGE
jgi:hypothetical protein